MFPITEFDGPRLLSAQEWALFTTPHRIDVELTLRVGDCWEPSVLRLDIDGAPLAVLAEAAARGHRVYEYMSLRRPGDILRYWMLRVVEAPAELPARVDRRLTSHQRMVYGPLKQGQSIPFVIFDATFWNQASRWLDEDVDVLDRGWIQWRVDQPRPAMLDVMFKVVQAAQGCLRTGAKGLLAHEIALMDRHAHARDCWASTAEIRYQARVPQWRSDIDPGLSEIIVSLARREDVGSVSCGFDDRVLWRELVSVQLQRAQRTGAEPQDALFLAGPEGGISDAEPQDWGGEVHIPYEGALDADLFVKPAWHNFHEDRARESGSVAEGLFGKARRYALVEGYYGEFPRDVCVRCGDWSLYRVLAR